MESASARGCGIDLIPSWRCRDYTRQGVAIVSEVSSFRHLRGALDAPAQTELWSEIKAVMAIAPPYRPTMPRTGKPFSVTMTNCGDLGWVSDKAGGYRYQSNHPVSGERWPAMPRCLQGLWETLARYPHPPEACLINIYAAGARMGSHVDADELDRQAPVLSVSLGDAAVFHVGGTRRNDPKQRVILRSGDVLILEGESRFAYHGIDRIHPASSSLIEGGGRINLTLRRVSVPPGIAAAGH